MSALSTIQYFQDNFGLVDFVIPCNHAKRDRNSFAETTAYILLTLQGKPPKVPLLACLNDACEIERNFLDSALPAASIYSNPP
ncbi:hypothetical protein BDN70DRAFT_533737 [Pholiota conissans]|uniref:Uncharacterized protein n=1 Tax=Pholiota conissans TaxID=109636 RepID=A0A9P5ZCM1_9AGAR|nr:hypothetical protein BDN70DRAFT_533737 [Pholiota conissans]